MNITIVPKNVFQIGKFSVRIKMSYDKYDTKYKGQVGVRRYLLYTPFNGGWRICQATWDKKAYKLPRLDFFFLDKNGVCTPAPGRVSEDAKRNIAAMCDSYDTQVMLARENGRKKVTIEDAINAPFETETENDTTPPDDFQDAVATV